jgi:hypothetical protein
MVMTQINQNLNIAIALQECGDEGDCVKLHLGDAAGDLFLSPAQARMLASELIQTVYRAEVKTSLKKRPELSTTAVGLSLVTPHAA